MADRINDIAWQAHQGSVAAIIQLLNDKLVESGVRTRAIFSDGVLQLLCEAQSVDQLEKTTIVQKIRQILESIAPRNIRRVNINSRIVREQQLLWLTEIYRDRDNQLLWSEEITLPKPNIFRQILKDFQDYKESKTELAQVSLPKPNSFRSVVFRRRNRNKAKNRLQSKSIPKQSLPLGLLKVSSLCLPLLLLVWGAYAWLEGKGESSTSAETSKSLTIQPQVSSLANTQNFAQKTEDPFVAAVRIANQASALGKKALTPEQRLELATKWQEASDLMSQVPAKHSRYQEAQSRIQLYKKYAAASQSIAAKPKPTPTPGIKTLSTPDPFAAAVRIANQASASGKTAASSEQWSTLAAKWQEASDLMSQVPAEHSRYQEAQSRIQLYKKFSEAAKVQAQKGQ
ncbi:MULTISPECIES: hypothetical protein [unclassified Tolypothrix]|uniref:hypothetical protein n=1 Tax=unclassified Tolypothrix TaxID=2649714 RepID=UPI0005EAB46E|nr:MULTISPECIES: hypothetical protein [unclassified Tolypothrix]EKE99856.1 hypothetical protein FDUTEX481_09734 [Tolypothrix sp. PCC 7601]BAY90898.1 hypothetical protein NIES3275_29170 [Microchaete diplosiphon NIES-3275]